LWIIFLTISIEFEHVSGYPSYCHQANKDDELWNRCCIVHSSTLKTIPRPLVLEFFTEATLNQSIISYCHDTPNFISLIKRFEKTSSRRTVFLKIHRAAKTPYFFYTRIALQCRVFTHGAMREFAPFSSSVKIDEDLNKMPNKEQKNNEDGNEQQTLQQV